MSMNHRLERSGIGPVGRRTALCAVLLLLAIVASPAVGAGSAGAPSGVVNINTASADELQLLPGVGKVRADAIVAMRKQRGAFKSVDELKEVKGIGDSMLDDLRPHVTLTGRTTARSTRAPSKAEAGSGGR
jgi:competence protein ComEA